MAGLRFAGLVLGWPEAWPVGYMACLGLGQDGGLAWLGLPELGLPDAWLAKDLACLGLGLPGCLACLGAWHAWGLAFSETRLKDIC